MSAVGIPRLQAGEDVKEWEKYYFREVYTREHLESLGRTLFIKVSEICRAEIESISEQDCVDFIIDLVIGLQIKPAGYAYIPQIINEIQFQKRSHEKFTEKFGGKVFLCYFGGRGKAKNNPKQGSHRGNSQRDIAIV